MKQRQTKVNITPEVAAGFLGSSDGNRGIREKTKLQAYIHDMKSGRWVYNGDAIRFTHDGVLIDGHHRLTACVRSGHSFEADIAYVEKDAVKTIDKGALRSDGDSLVMDYGYDKKTAGVIAASVKQIVSHDHGTSKWPTPQGTLMHLFTYQKINEWVEKNLNEMNEAVSFLGELGKSNLLIGSSHILTARLLGARSYGRDVCEEYLRRVLTGYGITPNSTEDHIRTALLQSRMAQRKMPSWVAAATVAKGMRAFAKGHNYTMRSNAVYRPGIDNMVFYK